MVSIEDDDEMCRASVDDGCGWIKTGEDVEKKKFKMVL